MTTNAPINEQRQIQQLNIKLTCEFTYDLSYYKHRSLTHPFDFTNNESSFHQFSEIVGKNSFDMRRYIHSGRSFKMVCTNRTHLYKPQLYKFYLPTYQVRTVGHFLLTCPSCSIPLDQKQAWGLEKLGQHALTFRHVVWAVGSSCCCCSSPLRVMSWDHCQIDYRRRQQYRSVLPFSALTCSCSIGFQNLSFQRTDRELENDISSGYGLWAEL